MILYQCRISDASGKVRDVEKSAGDEQALIQMINDEGLFLISYKAVNSRKGRKFPRKIILDFTDTMALMLKSGLSIRDALSVASTAFRDKRALSLISEINGSLNKGISFPETLDTMAGDFSPFYRGMVRIGDSSGSMEDIFSRLSGYLNDEKKMRDKITGALFYPVLILVVLFLVMTALYFFVLPQIRMNMTDEVLKPLLDRFQILISAFFFPLLTVIVFFTSLMLSSRSNGPLKKRAYAIILKIPLMGHVNLLRSSMGTMFALEVLTGCGFPIESALSESSSLLSNAVLRDSLLSVKSSITRGDSLSRAFAREKAFPDKISLWMGVGEASGDVTAVFSQLRVFFQGELDKLTSRFMMLIEPVLTLMVGLFMILLVILFIVPIFSGFGAAL